jgi:DNA-3-methyladenine glycosylase I
VDLNKPDYVAYHDQEWGVPVHDDRTLFEFLVLESAQAGLSWYTILKKREGYRQGFANFNPEAIASFSEAKVESLMGDSGIVRNRLKILATINNAQRFLKVQTEFGSFDAYLWRFVGGRPIVNEFQLLTDCPTQTPESVALAKDLRKRGFRFLGATTCYALMQAVGMVNDHTIDCFRWQQICDEYE